MKKNADKSKSEGGNNMPKRKKTSSKNGEIEIYLSLAMSSDTTLYWEEPNTEARTMLISQKWVAMKSTRSEGR